MTNQEIFDMYDRLFAEPGWKDLVEDFKLRQEALAKNLINSNTTEVDLYKAQGNNQIYNYIIGLESAIEAAKKQVIENGEANSI